jgi:hypothetical protein
VIYAHQGGWDEILLVLGPIAVIMFLLSLANKRATRQAAKQAQETSEGENTPTET